MKFLIQIKAYSIMSIMLFGMMHNVFPHVHHEDERAEITELRGDSHHHHHDTDHHNHSGENESDHEEKTFFDFLFKNHSHTKHTHQHTLTTVEDVKTVKQILVKFFGSSDSWEFSTKETDVGLHSYVLFNDIGLEDLNLNFNPHRGPPSLG